MYVCVCVCVFWYLFSVVFHILGEIIHSVDYNDAITNGYVGKRVLVVGIGNSAVDVAVDCATVGRYDVD